MEGTVFRNSCITKLAIITLLWGISPYVGLLIVLGYVFFSTKKISSGHITYLYILISLTFGLLAFTQKSLAAEDTDIQRYYFGLSQLTNYSIDALSLVLSGDVLTYTFTFVSYCVVRLMGNVQYMSLWWTFIAYFFYFLSLHKFAKIKGLFRLNNNREKALFLLFSIFGSLLFVQITETIKSAAAFSIFFYLLTCYINNESKIKIIILYIITFGIHSQVLLFLPLFFYKKCNTLVLFALLAISILCARFVDISSLSLQLLSRFGFADSLLQEKVEGYTGASGESSTIRYICESFVFISVGTYLWIKDIFNNNNKYLNIILIYSIVMWLNFNNSVAFIRFANFCSFVVAIEFLALIKHKKPIITCMMLGCFLYLNVAMTIGRTIVKHGYTSSYMDNSIEKIMTSNVNDYLSYIAY